MKYLKGRLENILSLKRSDTRAGEGRYNQHGSSLKCSEGALPKLCWAPTCGASRTAAERWGGLESGLLGQDHVPQPHGWHRQASGHQWQNGVGFLVGHTPRTPAPEKACTIKGLPQMLGTRPSELRPTPRARPSWGHGVNFQALITGKLDRHPDLGSGRASGEITGKLPGKGVDSY